MQVYLSLPESLQELAEGINIIFCIKWNCYSIYSNGICRIRLGNTGSRRGLSVGKRRLTWPNAFQAGWMSWFAHAVAGSLYAMGFGAYFVLVLNNLNISVAGLHGEALQKLITVIIILIFVTINYKGVSETGKAGNIVTVSKILILIIFIVSGIWEIVSHPLFIC